jgi:hypothetical protein
MGSDKTTTREPLSTEATRDASIQITVTTPHDGVALLTVRGKDRELTAEQLRAFARDLLAAANEIEKDGFGEVFGNPGG